MPKRTRRNIASSIVVASLLAACGAANISPCAFAQASANDQDAKPAETQLKIQSNLVVVRAQVRDAGGNPVRGLTQDDFKVFDRGKEQSIAQFEEEPASVVPLAAPATPASAPPPGQLPPTDRFIALYFDDLNTSDADLMQARDAADRYLSANLRPGDHIAIFTAGKALSNFISDPGQIHNALFKLHANSRGQTRTHECPDLSDYQAQELVLDSDMHSNAWVAALADVKICAPPPDPRDTPAAIRMLAERITARDQELVEDNLQMFAQVVKYIAQAPGSRTVILVSPGFLSQNDQLAIDRTIDRALRSQVIINSLDPKGLAVLMREGNASDSSRVLPDPRATAARHNLDRTQEFIGADVLAEFAEGTGGEFFHNNNDLKAGFDALAGHPDQYVLAFAPKNMKIDGKFHELKVTLSEKHKGYTILARRGYFAVKNETDTAPKSAPPASQSKSENAAVAQPPAAISTTAGPQPNPPSAQDTDQSHLDDALRSTLDTADLAVGMEASPAEGQGATRLLALTVHLDTKTLPLRKENVHHLDALTFAVAVFDQDNKVVEMKQRHARVDLTDDQLQDFLADGLDVNMMFELKPATYRLRVAVIEANEHKLAAFSRSVAVP